MRYGDHASAYSSRHAPWRRTMNNKYSIKYSRMQVSPHSDGDNAATEPSNCLPRFSRVSCITKRPQHRNSGRNGKKGIITCPPSPPRRSVATVSHASLQSYGLVRSSSGRRYTCELYNELLTTPVARCTTEFAEGATHCTSPESNSQNIPPSTFLPLDFLCVLSYVLLSLLPSLVLLLLLLLYSCCFCCCCCCRDRSCCSCCCCCDHCC